MNKKRIALAGIINWILGTIYTMLTCGWLFNWIYTIEPIIWKTPEEIMLASNYAGSSAVGLLASILLVLGYSIFYKSIPGKGVKKGLWYGFLIWLIGGSIAGIATMPFYMTIAWEVVIYWLLSGLILKLIEGAIIGLIYKN